ncbi:MAG: lytic murein transglycosylase, partial [Proteobacteria bacterium]|nr:lytic murein transglycosylase [Pseudomonadota bacterium]
VGAEESFAQWLTGVRAEALEKGVRAATLDQALTGVTQIPRVVELDRRQPEFTLTFPEYMSRVVPNQRVRKARLLMEEHLTLLQAVADKYRVQARFVVALWGIESDFGRLTGGFKVIPALATLAFDGRRSKFFRAQLFHALKILDQGHITVDRMTGSWAGAMGQPQFMPSSFVRFATDHDGDGRIDIWTTPADVFASAANYLARSGWRDDLTWGRPVRLPDGFAAAELGFDSVKPLPQWQEIGVRRPDGSDLPRRSIMASVIEAEAGKGPTFLVYQNFKTILKWNRSTFFALAVGHLADQLEER